MPTPKKPDCTELQKAIARLALNIGLRDDMPDLAAITQEMQKHIPQISRDEVVQSIVAATTAERAAARDIDQKLNQIKREARADRSVRAAITNLQEHLAKGTVPEPATRQTAHPSPEIAALRSLRDELNAALRRSDANLAKKYTAQIEKLTRTLEEPITAPASKPEPINSKEVQRLAFERDRLRTKIRDQIRDLKPKTFWSRAAEPLNTARSIMTSLDLSATLRQGGFVALGHPARAARALGDSIKAWASPRAAHAMHEELLARDNAPLYAKHKLHLSDIDGSLNAQEEAFMGRLTKRIPGVAGSERAYTTFLNRLRADSFDALAETLTRGGEATAPELAAIANYVNVATGRGKLPAKATPAGPALATAFFAPRYVLSRFQLLTGQPGYSGTWRTRRMVAQEYARFAAGIGVVYALGSLAGATVETDPRSSDFGKLRFGDTRLDPLTGLAQATVLMARLFTGETKNAKGRIEPLREGLKPMNLIRAKPDHRKPRYGQTDTWDVMSRFARSKLSPVLGTAADVLTGKNVAGEPVTPASAALRLVTPLGFGDIKDIMTHHGIPEGTALSLLAFLGMGANHYQSRTGSGQPKPTPPPEPEPDEAYR